MEPMNNSDPTTKPPTREAFDRVLFNNRPPNWKVLVAYADHLEQKVENTLGRESDSLHKPFNNLHIEFCKCSTNDCFVCKQLNSIQEDWMCLESERNTLDAETTRLREELRGMEIRYLEEKVGDCGGNCYAGTGNKDAPESCYCCEDDRARLSKLRNQKPSDGKMGVKGGGDDVK